MEVNKYNLFFEINKNSNWNTISEQMHLKAEISQEKILQNTYTIAYNNINKMKENEEKNTAMIFFISSLMNTCSDICIINTPSVIKFLNETVLTENETKWIIPTDNLNKALNHIEGDNKYLAIRPLIILTIEFYLSSKIRHAIIEKFRLKFKNSPEQSYYKLILQEVINSERKKNKTELFDVFWNNLNKNLEPFLDSMYDSPKKLRSILLNIASSKLDNILIPIYKEYTIAVNNNIKKNENDKLRTLYPLFKLLLKDRNWEDDLYRYGNNSGKLDNEAITRKMDKFIFKR